jgi:type II secretory pathway predicted ATPase ExeA
MITDFRSRFGFHSTPFTREFAVEQRFALGIFDESLTALSRAIENRMSAALIAPAGTGKTVLLRALTHGLPEARYRVHYVKVTELSKRDMCREIAVVCGAEPAGSYPMLVRRLQERFVTATAIDGVRPVLILDEAQDLRPDVLSILRTLTNYEMDSKLVLSILLAGQTPLRDILKREAHESITKRLAHFAYLRLLSREETLRYIAHRCTIAGATTQPWDSRALDAIYEISCGNLRAIDSLAYKALELAHDAGVSVVDSNHIATARKLVSP